MRYLVPSPFPPPLSILSNIDTLILENINCMAQSQSFKSVRILRDRNFICDLPSKKLKISHFHCTVRTSLSWSIPHSPNLCFYQSGIFIFIFIRIPNLNNDIPSQSLTPSFPLLISLIKIQSQSSSHPFLPHFYNLNLLPLLSNLKFLESIWSISHLILSFPIYFSISKNLNLINLLQAITLYFSIS